jgi:hypothetical protein
MQAPTGSLLEVQGPFGQDLQYGPVKAGDTGLSTSFGVPDGNSRSPSTAGPRTSSDGWQDSPIAACVLIAIIHPENIASQRVAEHIGLTLEKVVDRHNGRKRIYAGRIS